MTDHLREALEAIAGPSDSGPQPAVPETEQAGHAMSDRQVQRLIRLARDFDNAVEGLPDDKGKGYKLEQKEIADTRRQAQMSEGLLHLRVR